MMAAAVGGCHAVVTACAHESLAAHVERPDTDDLQTATSPSLPTPDPGFRYRPCSKFQA